MNVTQRPAKLDYVPGEDGLNPGEQARAHVTAPLEYRVGDGPLLIIEADLELALERAPQSLVLRWAEGGHPMSAAIPVVEFNALLASGQIVIKK